jgi:hypothetical protein
MIGEQEQHKDDHPDNASLADDAKSGSLQTLMAVEEKEEDSGDWFVKKANIVDQVLAHIEAQLNANDFKASVGDFIRLLQFRKELEEKKPREIAVGWQEFLTTENAQDT